MQTINFNPDQQPVETPSPLYISPTQLRAWRECPKKHDYIYHKCLKPKGRKVFFDKGNYTHELMHVYYQLLGSSGKAPGSDFLVSALLSRIRKDIELHTDIQNVEIYNSVMKLMSRYITIQSPKIDRGLRILGTEYEMQVPTGVYHEDREIILFGFIDLLYRTLRGDTVVRDHKTGANPRLWTNDTVEADSQLLMYGTGIWKLLGVVPKVEVNYCNTFEYKNKPSDNQFALYSAIHTEKEYKNFFQDTLQLISDMLSSNPTPHYDATCTRCAFYNPCRMERKGVSVENMINADYEIVDRTAIARPVPFTQQIN